MDRSTDAQRVPATMRCARGWRRGIPADASRMRPTIVAQRRHNSGTCTLGICCERLPRRETTARKMRHVTQPTSPYPDHAKTWRNEPNNSVTRKRAAAARIACWHRLHRPAAGVIATAVHVQAPGWPSWRESTERRAHRRAQMSMGCSWNGLQRRFETCVIYALDERQRRSLLASAARLKLLG